MVVVVIVGGGFCDHLVGGGDDCSCGYGCRLVAVLMVVVAMAMAATAIMVGLRIFRLVVWFCVVWWRW